MTLSLSATLASINSITSTAGQNLVLALGTGGTALTLTSSTLAATFAGVVASTSLSTGTVIIGSNIGLSGNAGGANWFGGAVRTSPASVPALFIADRSANTNYGGLQLKTANTDDWLVGHRETSDSDFHIYSYGAAANVLNITRAAGIVTITATTASTSTTTGALVVSGGVGVAGAAYVGGGLIVSLGSTDPITWVNGLNRVGYLYSDSAGVGIFNAASAGEDGVYLNKTAHSVTIRTNAGTTAATFDSSQNAIFAGTINTLTVNSTTGAITLGSASSITAASLTDLTLAAGSSGATLVLGQGTNGSVTITPTGTGRVVSSTTIQAQPTNKTVVGAMASSGLFVRDDTGSIGNIAQISFGYFGTYSPVSIHSVVVNNAGSTACDFVFSTRSATTDTAPVDRGRITSTGNWLVGGSTDITGSGGLKVFGTTAATSTTTGAFQCAGGVGIAGAIYAGTEINVVRAAGSAQVNLTSSAGTTNAFVSFTNTGGTGYIGQESSTGGGIVTGSAAYGLSFTAAASRNVYIGVNNGVLSATFSTTGLTLAATTASTSTTTGSLINAGGFGNAGAAYIGGIVNAAGTGTHTFGTTNTVTMAAGKISTNAGSWASASTGQVFYTATGGLNLAGSGSTYDFQILNKNGDLVIYNPTNTQNAVVAGDLTVSGGNVGVGGASAADTAIYIRNSATTTGADQHGLYSFPTVSSAATNTANAVIGILGTQAASFTLASGYTLRAGAPVVGAASAITTLTGVRVENQGATGITNAYGIDIAAQSGAATVNVGLRNAGKTIFNPTLAVTAAIAVDITPTFTTSGGTHYGLNVDATASGNNTDALICVKAVTRTTSAHTITGGYNYYSQSPELFAGAAITTQYGLYVSNQGHAQVTNAYGIDIAAQSGAATVNVGLRNAGTTQLTNATEATSLTAASAVLSGGLAVTKTLIVGGGTGLGVASTVTAGGTTTLTAASATVQRLTGSGFQNIQLPAANALGAGVSIVYVIVNASVGGAANILRAGSDTIDDAASYSVPVGGRVIIVGDGVSAWNVV